MKEAVINPVDVFFSIRIEEVSYCNERWYAARGGSGDYVDQAYSRSHNKAVAFLLEKLAVQFRDTGMPLPAPTAIGVTAEVMDVKLETKRELEKLKNNLSRIGDNSVFKDIINQAISLFGEDSLARSLSVSLVSIKMWGSGKSTPTQLARPYIAREIMKRITDSGG